MHSRMIFPGACAGVLCAMLACRQAPPPDGPPVTTVYDSKTGKLSELLSDRNGDGKNDTHAFMDGALLQRVEIDKNGDGTPDRFEYYLPPSAGGTAQQPWLDHVEERLDGRVVRRETYSRGVIARVEEDTDADGRIDKWETYENGTLVRMDLDLTGRGTPDRRLVYGPNGEVTAVQSDPDGDGRFETVSH